MKLQSERVEEVGDFKGLITKYLPKDGSRQALVGHQKPHNFRFTRDSNGEPIMQVHNFEVSLDVHLAKCAIFFKHLVRHVVFVSVTATTMFCITI
jgi:hypothetical protein